jgi:hypothetical protein
MLSRRILRPGAITVFDLPVSRLRTKGPTLQAFQSLHNEAVNDPRLDNPIAGFISFTAILHRDDMSPS